MGSLNLTTLSNGMNIVDKMRLLFEDLNAEAEGSQTVLTPKEREALISDARKRGEMHVIRKTNRLYMLSNYACIEIDRRQLLLLLALSDLNKILMGVVLKGGVEEIVGQIVYDLAKKESDNKEKLDQKIKEIEKRYKIETVIYKGFDLFSSDDQDPNTLHPNDCIQDGFKKAVKLAKNLKLKLYELEYILTKTEIDFMPKQNKELVVQCDELIEAFTNLNDTLRTLRIYRDHGDTLTGKVHISDAEFLSMIKDIKFAIQLTEVEKDKVKSDIDTAADENL